MVEKSKPKTQPELCYTDLSWPMPSCIKHSGFLPSCSVGWPDLQFSSIPFLIPTALLPLPSITTRKRNIFKGQERPQNIWTWKATSKAYNCFPEKQVCQGWSVIPSRLHQAISEMGSVCWKSRFRSCYAPSSCTGISDRWGTGACRKGCFGKQKNQSWTMTHSASCEERWWTLEMWLFLREGLCSASIPNLFLRK